MPNWCSNNLRLTHEDKEKIDALEQAVLRSLDPNDESDDVLNHLRPNPAGEWDYGWSVENWGTKWDVHVHNWEREDENTLVIDFDSAWAPPIELYEWLSSEEQGWEVSAMYEEPGMGFVGEFADGFDQSYEYDFSDPEWQDDIPEHLVDYAGLEYAYEDWKEWNEDEMVEDDD